MVDHRSSDLSATSNIITYIADLIVSLYSLWFIKRGSSSYIFIYLSFSFAVTILSVDKIDFIF